MIKEGTCYDKLKQDYQFRFSLKKIPKSLRQKYEPLYEALCGNREDCGWKMEIHKRMYCSLDDFVVEELEKNGGFGKGRDANLDSE